MNLMQVFTGAALTAVLTLSLSGFAQADVTIYQDLDPLTAPNAVNSLIVNTVDASVITSDITRTAVGEVVLTGATKFVGFNPGALALSPTLIGQTATFSMDYFVPVGTTLDENVFGSPDLFWLQISFDGGNNGSAGFVGSGAAGTGWQTISFDTVIAPLTTNISPLFVLADDGFGAGTANGTGTGVALYVDNFRLTSTEAVPEPGSLALIGLGALGLFVRRRK